jgi:hypothetical protein
MGKGKDTSYLRIADGRNVLCTVSQRKRYMEKTKVPSPIGGGRLTNWARLPCNLKTLMQLVGTLHQMNEAEQGSRPRSRSAGPLNRYFVQGWQEHKTIRSMVPEQAFPGLVTSDFYAGLSGRAVSLGQRDTSYAVKHRNVLDSLATHDTLSERGGIRD